MNRKLVYSFVLVVVLMGVLAGSFNIHKAEASGTIYIKADGAIEPLTANITRIDNITYYFIDNNHDSIVVERNNIVIDGKSHILQGVESTGTGISLVGRKNVTIKNMEVRAFGNSIYLQNSSENTISESNIENNYYGILLSDSNGNDIYRNNITNNQYGIGLFNSSNQNSICQNNIANNFVSIWLFGSSLTSIYHNNFINNTERVATLGSVLNIWDDGYPSGGNYWSDYEERYPNATEIDGSGIWDTPYVIDGSNQDNYPLIPECPSFIIIQLFMTSTLLAVMIYRKKRTTNS